MFCAKKVTKLPDLTVLKTHIVLNKKEKNMRKKWHLLRFL
jgi:hypothetical protein